MQSSLLVLMGILSWCGLCACHACHDKAKVTENGLHLCLLLCFRYWRFLPILPCGRFISSISLQSLHCLFAFYKGCFCCPLSNKIGFTSFGHQLQKIRHFRFSKREVFPACPFREGAGSQSNFPDLMKLVSVHVHAHLRQLMLISFECTQVKKNVCMLQNTV